ncbi:hypothetical protein V1280_003439 [Bradyrhizobium sp. AZCC 2230]
MDRLRSEITCTFIVPRLLAWQVIVSPSTTGPTPSGVPESVTTRWARNDAKDRPPTSEAGCRAAIASQAGLSHSASSADGSLDLSGRDIGIRRHTGSIRSDRRGLSLSRHRPTPSCERHRFRSHHDQRRRRSAGSEGADGPQDLWHRPQGQALFPTAAGRQLLKEIQEATDRVQHRILAPLSRSEQKTFMELLEPLGPFP